MAQLSHRDAVLIDGILTIMGTNEADNILISYTYDDININAGNGNDTIYGNHEDNIINAGNGNDLIYFTNGNDVVNGGDGIDQVHFQWANLYSLEAYSISGGLITISTISSSASNYSNVELFSFGGEAYTPNSMPTYTPETLENVYATSDQTIFGTEEADLLSGGSYDDTIFAGNGDDEVYGSLGDDTINGGDGNDILYDGRPYYLGYNNLGSGDDVLNGGDGNDTLYGSSGNNVFIGGLGDDVVFGGGSNGTFVIDVDQSQITNISKDLSGGYRISSAFGNDKIRNVDSIRLNDVTIAPSDLLEQKAHPTIFVNGNAIKPNTYIGPLDYLEYTFLGEASNDVVSGSLGNDFFNLKEGDDAADGSVGDDVIDGGSGSNFLTGGDGIDTFFLDGRGGNITWSTIADFSGDMITIWGWNEGTSKLVTSEDHAGAAGYMGATLHYDLNDDGTIDTSVTFSGLALSEIPQNSANTIDDTGYLFFY